MRTTWTNSEFSIDENRYPNTWGAAGDAAAGVLDPAAPPRRGGNGRVRLTMTKAFQILTSDSKSDSLKVPPGGPNVSPTPRGAKLFLGPLMANTKGN